MRSDEIFNASALLNNRKETSSPSTVNSTSRTHSRHATIPSRLNNKPRTTASVFQMTVRPRDVLYARHRRRNHSTRRLVLAHEKLENRQPP
jgi:hypothetical protein